MKKRQAARRDLGRLRLGRITITSHPNGKLWIQHSSGEGMSCDEKKVAQHLEKFFRREF